MVTLKRQPASQDASLLLGPVAGSVGDPELYGFQFREGRDLGPGNLKLNIKMALTIK